MLSVRTKESIKTALAMTIAYGIALSMDWDRPYWAGLAVAFISLSTIGQSLNKGAMRMLGTLIALLVSLAIIALFAQERWGFMVALFGIGELGLGDALYFSFITGLTIGYGDILVPSIAGRIIAVLICLVGILVTGMIVAAAVKAVQIMMDEERLGP